MRKYVLVIFFVILVSLSFSSVFGELDTISVQENKNRFNDATITWIDRCVIQGHTSAVQITDHSMNKDPEKIEQFEIEVWSDSEEKIVTPYATETGPDTGIFEVTVFFYTTDEATSQRIRAFAGDTIFARHVINGIFDDVSGNRISVSGIPMIAEITVWEDTRHGKFSEIIYGPCTISYLERQKDNTRTHQFEMLFPAPLKQIQSGLHADEIVCKESLVLVARNNDTFSCVKPETKQKLEERNWTYQKESTLLVLDDNQQDIGLYLKQVSILDESSIDATVSYPTNTAHHKMFPDEHQSIVSDCTENNNGANLSLLYLKEIDNIQNKMTFKVEDRKFEGLQCNDALWQELTKWGYCGPPDHVIPHIDVAVSSIADAQRKVGFVFDIPKYLPEGYDIQKVTVGRDNDRATLYISPEPITDETQACDFAWSHEGIYMFYGVHPEILNFGSRYSDTPGEPQIWPLTINGEPGLAEQRWVGDRFGMPIPQGSDLQVSMPDDNILIQISSSLPVEELIKIAESISDPIFNSDIIPDYSRVSSQTKNNNDETKKDSIPVKITGKTSKQICNKIKMECNDDHFFSATYNLQTNTATLKQTVSYNNYVLEISNNEICYKINSDPSDYCSFLNVDYSLILDGNKPTMLSQPMDFWKDLQREEQFSFHGEYGDLFFEELGKMVLKDEIRKELERQNIANANNDFRLHTGMVEESLPPFVYYTTVINSTDGKSYMFGGRTHTNLVLDVYHEELIFYDDVSSKHQIDFFRNDSPVIIIRPENESDENTDKLFVNFDKSQEVTFVNSLSVPIRIQDKGSGAPEKEHELAWIGPMIKPNETWVFQINSTGYYEWNSKLAPTEDGGWWEPHESGDIIVYSEDMSDVDFREKLRIAGEFVLDSEIPTAGIGMGNSEGLRIGFSQAIIEMIPDAKKYYMERAKQAIPFDVPIILMN